MSDEDTELDTQSGDSSAQSGSGSSGSSDGTQSSANPQETVEETVPRSEVDKIRERMRAADQRAAKYESDLKQLRDKDLPELEKLKRDAEETAKSNEKLLSELRSARLENAFLSANDVVWHSPAAALKLLDMSKVDIADDGSVTGLRDALKALAKEHPYLVKTEEKAPAESETQAASGTPPMNGKPTTDTKSKAALRTRYPALGTRS